MVIVLAVLISCRMSHTGIVIVSDRDRDRSGEECVCGSQSEHGDDWRAIGRIDGFWTRDSDDAVCAAAASETRQSSATDGLATVVSADRDLAEELPGQLPIIGRRRRCSEEQDQRDSAGADERRMPLAATHAPNTVPTR